MSRFIVGTAGHIDHGKTTLIKALTGIGTDRLKEEEKRGISIVNGYAFLPYKDDLISIIDVPGHERFVKNMLAGITAIDLVLFVVAGDEGVMAQTTEHFDIVELLGIEKGMFLITKADLVDEAMLELVREDIRDLTKDSSLSHWPILEVSGYTGKNLDEVKQFIYDAYDSYEQKPSYYPRLNVDRLFQTKGFGDIVTGSLEGSDLSKDMILTQYPGLTDYRIRSIETHDHSVDVAPQHSRVALNLASDKKNTLQKGAVLSIKGKHFLTHSALVELKLLKRYESLFKAGDKYKVYFGSDELMGKISKLTDDIFELTLESDILLYRNQMGIVRSLTPVRTIGRLSVWDQNPPQGRKARKHYAEVADHSLFGILSKYPYGASLDDLERELTIHRDLIDTSGLLAFSFGYLTKKRFEELKKHTLDTLTKYFEANPLKQAMSREDLKTSFGEIQRDVFDELLKSFESMGILKSEGDSVSLSGREISFSSEDDQLKKEILEEFKSYDLTPPLYKEFIASYSKEKKKLFDYLVETGTIVKISADIFVLDTCLNYLKNDIIKYLREHERLEVKDVREIRDLSRKYIVPYLEYFDAKKITVRDGNYRLLKKEYRDG
ncbi:selenocysteine-specific translation elongation factor [Guggenheimella bovis]